MNKKIRTRVVRLICMPIHLVGFIILSVFVSSIKDGSETKFVVIKKMWTSFCKKS